MYCLKYFKFTLGICWIPSALCMNSGYLAEGDIAQLLNAKLYLPDEQDLPKSSVVKTTENDATYILSKLSDNELLKLLNKFPKKNAYTIDDIIQVSKDFKNNQKEAFEEAREVPAQNELQPVFRLENQKVDPYKMNKEADPKYNALLKLNNILFSRPRDDISAENEEKKEILFDIMVAQLKKLCCKRNKIKKVKTPTTNKARQIKKPIEYIFLVINDEIKSNMTDELIPVDPDSLSKNSSVLLLGPITTPLSDEETKLVMNRISNELSNPEYLPLLNKIAEGNLGQKNSDILKSVISGPSTRRYIKPHRCNHQSKLARIHVGPKWLVCTGYLNLNVPSLYD